MDSKEAVLEALAGPYWRAVHQGTRLSRWAFAKLSVLEVLRTLETLLDLRKTKALKAPHAWEAVYLCIMGVFAPALAMQRSLKKYRNHFLHTDPDMQALKEQRALKASIDSLEKDMELIHYELKHLEKEDETLKEIIPLSVQEYQEGLELLREAEQRWKEQKVAVEALQKQAPALEEEEIELLAAELEVQQKLIAKELQRRVQVKKSSAEALQEIGPLLQRKIEQTWEEAL